MTPHGTDPGAEHEVRDRLARAAEEVTPPERLDAIFAAGREARAHGVGRRWRTAGVLGGTAAATAAALLVLDGAPGWLDRGPDHADPPPVAGSTGPVEPRTSHTPDSAPRQRTRTEPVYYVAEAPDGDRLFREFHRVPADEPVVRSLQASVDGAAADPDYRSLWPAGTRVVRWHLDAGRHHVDLGDSQVARRPAGMSTAEAELAVQQLVYTAQSAEGGRSPVVFEADGVPLPSVLGVSTGDAVDHAPLAETMTHVGLSDPNEGTVVEGDRIEVSATAQGLAGPIRIQLRDGDRVIAEQRRRIDSDENELLRSVQLSFDGDLPPGEYQVRVVSSAGDAPGEDQRTIRVR